MTTEAALRPGLERLLRPRSIAVVGISKEPGSLGETQVGNFARFGFTGDVHLVSRNRNEVDGRACVRSVDELPHGIDAAVLCVPRAGVVETLEALARRGVGGAMVFASGFAEQDDAGRADQQRIVEIAAASGMAVNGPNCLGLTNYVDGIAYAFGASMPQPVPPGRTAAAVVTQSGATMVNVARALTGRGIAITYQMSTGNEAVIGIEDYLTFVLDDDRDGPIALFAEQIRQPQRFLALARRARERGRHLVLLHPGRSEGARAAAQSHTGAMAGDDVAMRTAVADAGVLIADDLDMLIDTVTLLARYPQPPRGGIAVTSDSGAVKSLVLDESAALGSQLAAFAPVTTAAIHEALPAFAVASNPLDLTAQCIYDPYLYERTAHAMLADPNVGSFLAVLQVGPNLRWLRENGLFDELRATDKPAMLSLPHGDSRWPDDLIKLMAEREIAFTTSGSHALRALTALTEYGARRERRGQPRGPVPDARPIEGRGPLAEYTAKTIVRGAGFAVPHGDLAHDLAGARAIASRIGYPVALKAQHVALLHKSDAGGVALNIGSDDELAAAWERITANVRRSRPDIVIDEFLVETMASPGLELIVGAKRDPDWGTVLLAGLGGIWTEILRDVAFFAGDASVSDITEGLQRLQGAPLLAGARGAAGVDIAAVAAVVARIGAFMHAHPEIVEFELNPLLAYPPGREPLALDALIVVR